MLDMFKLLLLYRVSLETGRFRPKHFDLTHKTIFIALPIYIISIVKTRINFVISGKKKKSLDTRSSEQGRGMGQIFIIHLGWCILRQELDGFVDQATMYTIFPFSLPPFCLMSHFSICPPYHFIVVCQKLIIYTN